MRNASLIRLLAIIGVAVLGFTLVGSASAKHRKGHKKKPSKALTVKPGSRPVTQSASSGASPTTGFVPVISSSASSGAPSGGSGPDVVSGSGSGAAAPSPTVSVSITRDGSSAFCRYSVNITGLVSTTPPLNGMTLGLMSADGDLQSVGRLDSAGGLSSGGRLTTGGGVGTWGSAAGTARLYIYARSSALGGFAYIPFEGNVFVRGTAVRAGVSNSCA